MESTDYFAGGMLAQTTLWVVCLQRKDGRLVCSSFWVESSYGQLVGGMIDHNIYTESKLVDGKSKLQWNLKNRSPPPSNDLSIVQEKQISSYTSYERSETQTDNVYDKADICTPEQTITPENSKEKENLHYDTLPINIYKKPLLGPFLANQQGKKCSFETEEDDEEFGADLMIVGGKDTKWIVNGIQIKKCLTEYQSKKNLPKTRPEYYGVIFFNSNKDGFLETLDESIITQMLSNISKKETENTVESEIKLLLDNIIDHDIKRAKEKLKTNKGRRYYFI
ncbi:7360_t:CDS:2 [Entrophospora sp. SA101]|nr:7360_t:CDS:2 [Entrophospora sp. SA101]